MDDLEKNVPAIKSKKIVTENDFWLDQSVDVWEAEKFEGLPHFYPVYKWGDYYSFSLFSLLKLKKSCHFNLTALNHLYHPDFRYLPAGIPPDAEIERVGGVLSPVEPVIRDESTFIEKFAEAMCADWETLDATFPGYTYLILTGGKDSLNLLLLPTKNRVVAASGHPNFPLVKEFCQRNELDIPVEELRASGREEETRDLLINCCRLKLSHVRWSGAIAELARKYAPAIIMTGHLGDTFLTEHWREYESYHGGWHETHWYRGAHWQGVHLAMMREFAGAPSVSGYHGGYCTQVLKQLHFEDSIVRDVRPDLGRSIRGSDVWYPESNPGPARMEWKRRDHEPDRFRDQLIEKEIGIEIENWKTVRNRGRMLSLKKEGALFIRALRARIRARTMAKKITGQMKRFFSLSRQTPARPK